MNKTEKFWDSIAKNFDKSEKRFDQIHIKTIENTKKYLNDSDIVLDYGCGTGTKALELVEKVKIIQGIDISSKMIEAAKRKVDERKIENVEFSHATLFDTSYESESFDVVLAFNILHLLENSQRAIKKITELLKSGGLFIASTPCLKEKMKFLNKVEFSFFLFLSKLGLIPKMLAKFKISELEDLITTENFQIIETEILFEGITSYFIAAKKN